MITDGSLSIGTDGFATIKAWLESLSEYFDFSPSTARFGLVQGSDLINEHAVLTNGDDNDEVTTIINNYKWNCPTVEDADGCRCGNAVGSECGYCKSECEYCASSFQSWLGEGIYRAGEILDENKGREDKRDRSSCVAVYLSDALENNPWIGDPGSQTGPDEFPYCNEYEAYYNSHSAGEGKTQEEAATYIKDTLGCTLIVVQVGLEANTQPSAAQKAAARRLMRSMASNDPTTPLDDSNDEAYLNGKLYYDGGDFDPDDLEALLPIIQREACVCTDACSGHGVCTVAGTCVCDSSYYGEACESSYVPLVVGAFAALGVLGAGLLVMHRFWQVAPPPAPPIMDEPKVEAPLMIEPTMDTDANAAGAPPAMDNRPLFSPASRVTPGGVKGAAGVEAGTATYV